MRVEVGFELEESSEKLEIPWKSEDSRTTYLDLRESPMALEQIEPARRHRPLRSFLTVVNSDDSLFATARCKTWLEQAPPTAGAEEPCQFISRVDLIFAAESFNLERSHYDDLTRRLAELLTRDTAPESLWAALRVHACRFRAAARWGFCLRIWLHALGATPEQAELRSGLGLARIQQALLFVSRFLRQQMAQTP